MRKNYYHQVKIFEQLFGIKIFLRYIFSQQILKVIFYDLRKHYIQEMFHQALVRDL